MKYRIIFVATAALAAAGAYYVIAGHAAPAQPSAGQDPAVASYLARRFEGMTSCGGSTFVSYDLMGERVEGGDKEQYVWALIQEFCVDDGRLASGSGTSQPIKVVSRLSGGAWVPERDEVTADGSGHADSVRRIFPKDVQDKIFADTGTYNVRVDVLEARNRAAAAEYFGLQSS